MMYGPGDDWPDPVPAVPLFCVAHAKSISAPGVVGSCSVNVSFLGSIDEPNKQVAAWTMVNYNCTNGCEV